MSTLAWRSYEHKHKDDKTPDWFWALGLVAISTSIASIVMGNALFGLLVLLASVVLGLSVNQKPEENEYTVTTRGISINNILHPYKNLVAFWIDETHPERNVLIIDAQKPLLPHLIINLPDSVNKDELQDFLLDYLPEEELYESPAHKIAEMFGF